MAGVNKVIIVGNLGADPEVRFMPSGDAVANFTVATSETWKDKQSGEQKEKTEWHRVAVFGKVAEIAGEYLKKGSKVYLEGSLQTRKWTNNEGQDQYTTEIVLKQFNGVMQMLDSKPQGQQQSGGFQGQQQNQQTQQQNNGFQQQSPQNQGGFSQQSQQQTYNKPQQQQPSQQQIEQQQRKEAKANKVQQNGGHQQGGYAQQGQQQQGQQQGNFQQQGQQQNVNPQEPSIDFDDDIPF